MEAILKHIVDNDLGYDVYLARNKNQVDQAIDEIIKSRDNDERSTSSGLLDGEPEDA